MFDPDQSRGTSKGALVLASNLFYRRELFGATVYNCEDKSVRFFNLSAAYCLEAFMLPKSVAAAGAMLSSVYEDAQSVCAFIETLEQQRMLEQSTTPHPASQRFFMERLDFDPDRLVAPLGLEFELTLRCRRKCTYCAYSSHPQYPATGEMTLNSYAEAFSKARDAGVFYVRFTGGDPLFRSDALEIIEEADTRGFAIAVASDLTALNAGQIARLAGLKNLTVIQTTLDGPNALIADRHRGNGSFATVIEGITQLRSANIPVMVGTVLTTDNASQIYAIAQVLAPFRVSYCVSPLYSAGRGRSVEHLIPNDDDLADAYEQFAHAVDSGLVAPADPGWSAIAKVYERSKRSALWRSQPWLLRSPDRILRIDPWGNCYAGIQAKEALHDNVYVGNITQRSLLEIWASSPTLNLLRAQAEPNTYFGAVVDIRSLRRTANA